MHETRGDQGLDGHPGVRIFRKQRIQNAVADLVTDLVRVTLCDRLGGEETQWCAQSGTPKVR
jgi:hypothetical protein